MFNVFKYDQQVKLSKEIDKIKKDYLKEREVRKGILHQVNKKIKIIDLHKIIKKESKISLLPCLRILLFIMTTLIQLLSNSE